jgi:NADPH-dependent 2,4-dienoyl-CoA reductase/sulfur reductase-like enzyme/rhodanese-related sulfurtransferase
VAGGASCAARARRLDENAEIVLFERGPHVSFANCGLPYHVGDVIPNEQDLLLVTPERFRERFDIDVRVHNEVTSIDRERQRLGVRDRRTDHEYEHAYDALVLAPGARPLRPPIEGGDLPGVFTLRTVPDTRKLRDWIREHDAKRAVVVGAGFVGLEMAENLKRRGLEVHILELQPQVMAPLDPEMARPLAEHLEQHGIHLHLGEGLGAVRQQDGSLRVEGTAQSTFPADLVLLGLGVRPEVELAQNAGLTIGTLGGIAVDEQMRTNDAHIWAVGDAVEDRCFVTGAPRLIPLAGPANRQGRLAADTICGRNEAFRGVQGTTVCGLFGMTVAATGVNEKSLRQSGRTDWDSVWLHPSNHVGYYPGARTIDLKLIFSRPDGRVLGAQAVGESDVEKRIDVLSMAIQMGATVYDLEQAELCYAPQFGAAKDPVNVAGMVAANALRGDAPMASWAELPDRDIMLLDVREPDEFQADHVPGAHNVPLSELRQRLDELPRDRELWLYCKSGKRSYDAARALTQRGFRVRNISGGIESWRQGRASRA